MRFVTISNVVDRSLRSSRSVHVMSGDVPIWRSDPSFEELVIHFRNASGWVLLAKDTTCPIVGKECLQAQRVSVSNRQTTAQIHHLAGSSLSLGPGRDSGR